MIRNGADVQARERGGLDMGSIASEETFTKDGTVDLHGNPAQKSKTGGWRACPFILGNECCERLAYYGIATNLVVYLKNRLNQPNATAATNVTNWSGTCYLTPLIGAFIADSYLGRFWTIALFSTIYFFGMLLLTLSASVPALNPCHGAKCTSATLGQLSAFYGALYLIAVGTGGIKPCVSSFGADQFDDEDPEEKKYKTSFFNWFYFSINIGALVSSSVLVYIQDQVSWAWGFGVPAVAMAIAIFFFFMGTNRYRHQRPGGSALTRIAQVFVAAARKWRLPVPNNRLDLHEESESAIRGSRKIQHTNSFRFLDRAAVPVRSHTAATPWSLCTVTQVEEVKIILRILPIWASSIIFSTVYDQMSTLFVEQGSAMNTYVGSSNFRIPPASLSIFDTLSVIIWVPVYDRLLVPIMRRYTKHPQGLSQLQRMGVGLLISTLSMIVAAIVEIRRLHIVRERGLVDADMDSDHYQKHLERLQMSIFWQAPQYFLIGASEVFTFIGQIEFFYEQSPDAMRSLGSALSLTTNSLSNYLSSLLVTIVTRTTRRNGSPGWIADNLNKGHMDYFFWLLAVLSVLNILFYVPFAYRYQYKTVASNEEQPASLEMKDLHQNNENF